ncbi:glycerol-3-phosphate 1-O-acyltransferase PlsY [Ancylomarina sp. 16SWW S1-10-2]|uniref:glycerol-3-phosphate 1-O-acyltransferase PlsY n=1 Tax=Ancylomarina sp. 16SWW S1-10-2 TaxID=2499681 RepID=UPI0012AE39B2|nr:glycerol-3-phosphate 1-O-acyltransferase PlsY [Ancylomarina sp. 16SWW S1-10-2]MRT92703.1 glycerol-3-phosphate 1-O-acyltransferase [Ancylomarina sp. 16SWW S1-10-2]
MTLELKIVLLVLTYLLGSIPFGYLLIKFSTGKNILKHGSGNIGSTNVRRVAGKKMSIVTQLLDMLKGLIPVALFLTFSTSLANPNFIFMLALVAIIGHDFSLFLKFKGGKGVNTTLGASVLIAPYSVFISVAIYFIVKWRFKYVSMGSIALAIAMPIVELILHEITPTFFYLAFSSVLIILRHQKNMIRLLNGTESC